jgi:hypothetical protein
VPPAPGRPSDERLTRPSRSDPYNDALAVTETLGGTSAGESTARADEGPRILRFIGSTRPGA